ncbi:hypothetical protein roselon_01597 [Roseibacterium elongatum DSM 19469]|uniref:Diacylglycerol O-acyltransferase n=1 Tax=Roseicyclus elongatus DSM 19469 TaxID=1294273 RepID=W8RS46_9RHOB|nr:hypothetical protein [Roseibacterium elongatum]AHM03979.1 hypothetical protein roselon_01597 [Roseibacterium elongatum DSM 19469]
MVQTGAALTPSERILWRSGPNLITVFAQTQGAIDAARALAGVMALARSDDRLRRVVQDGPLPQWGPEQALDPAAHLKVLRAPGLIGPEGAATLLDTLRRQALPGDRPGWQAVVVNPDGPSDRAVSGLALHLDHAIGDGTRLARALLGAWRHGSAPDGLNMALPVTTFEDLSRTVDPRIDAVPPATLRLRLPSGGASGRIGALIRAGAVVLERQELFGVLPPRQRASVSIARFASRHSAQGALRNDARMVRMRVSESAGDIRGLRIVPPPPEALYRLKLGLGGVLPARWLRRAVDAEFSAPGQVLTIIPGHAGWLEVGGAPIRSVMALAPAMGHPPLALTGVSYRGEMHLTVSARGPDGRGVSAEAAETLRDALVAT